MRKPADVPVGWTVISMGTVNSTNTIAMELGERDAPHGTVVVADRQTKGRGRLGRKWISPAGNIYMSILLRPTLTPADAPLLTLTAAVACARALRGVSNLQVEIKWPNDLVITGKKLGGILTEMKSRGDRILFAVVGIGINLNSGVTDFPPELREAATSVSIETGKKKPRTGLLRRVLEEIGFWYHALTKGETDRILDEWRHLSSTLGKSVRITAGKETFEGVAEALDGAGRLIVKSRSGIQKVISAGDVTMVR